MKMDSENNRTTDTYPIEWETPDGAHIVGKDWYVKSPKAVLAIVHGFGEHMGRYDVLGKWYQSQGIAVIGFDLRGHGLTSGKRGHVDDYELLLDDVDGLISQAVGHFGDAPIFLMGHSMGGNIVLNYIKSRVPKDVKGFIVASPWITLVDKASTVAVALGKMMRRIKPNFTQKMPIDVKVLSWNEDNQKAYKEDPLVHAMISAELGLSVVERGEGILHEPFETNAPLLLMHGEDDSLTSKDSTKQLAGQAKGEVTLKMWHHCKHELHNEDNKEQIFSFVRNWMIEKV